jgi:mannosyltransferase OCH1-like enzyme
MWRMKGCVGMIPKKLHYVWVGGPLPAAQREFLASWPATNPDYEIIAWDEGNIDFTIPNLKLAYDQKRWATVADIVRLWAVSTLGGIYLDTDFRLLKPLDELLMQKCLFCFQQIENSADWVTNAVFGAEPNHWFIRHAFDRVIAIKPKPFGLTKPTSYGPKLITRLLREYGLNHYSSDGVYVRDILVLPKEVFTPFDWTETFTDSCITEKTLAVHFWAQSWKSGLPAPVRLIKNARAIIREWHEST